MNRPEIVVGFDDSPSAEAALLWAGAEAVRRGATVRAIHVLSWPYGAELAPGESPPVTHDDLDAAYQASITRRFDRTRPRPDWILQFAQGDAGPVLVRQAQHALALVLGSPDHVGLGRLLAGSVAHYCLSHAAPPVICVPAGRETAPSDNQRSLAATRSQPMAAGS
jgi:nucleotide-binding universal stress UspA family protein